ncbi:unnamed protein product [Urochloa humidicola]
MTKCPEDFAQSISLDWNNVWECQASNQSGSNVDDFGPSFVQKVSDYGCLTPVHEEVKGTNCATYFSCDDQSHRAPEPYHGPQRTIEMVQKPIVEFGPSSTNYHGGRRCVLHYF